MSEPAFSGFTAEGCVLALRGLDDFAEELGGGGLVELGLDGDLADGLEEGRTVPSPVTSPVYSGTSQLTRTCDGAPRL